MPSSYRNQSNGTSIEKTPTRGHSTQAQRSLGTCSQGHRAPGLPLPQPNSKLKQSFIYSQSKYLFISSNDDITPLTSLISAGDSPLGSLNTWSMLPSSGLFFFFLKKIFIWLCQVFVAACGIQFPDQGLNLGPLHWDCRVLASAPPGKCQDLLNSRALWLSAYGAFTLHL